MPSIDSINVKKDWLQWLFTKRQLEAKDTSDPKFLYGMFQFIKNGRPTKNIPQVTNPSTNNNYVDLPNQFRVYPKWLSIQQSYK